MLVLARKDGEGIRIGDEIVITIVSTSGGQVRLGIEAPTRITIHREEIYDRIAEANRQALAAAPANSSLDPTLPPMTTPTSSMETPE